MRHHELERRTFQASEQEMNDKDIEFLEKAAKGDGWVMVGWRWADRAQTIREFVLERMVSRGRYRRIPKGWRRT